MRLAQGLPLEEPRAGPRPRRPTRRRAARPHERRRRRSSRRSTSPIGTGIGAARGFCRLPSPRRALHVPLPDGRALELGARTLVMGIVNVTPDSFADGGVRFDPGRRDRRRACGWSPTAPTSSTSAASPRGPGAPPLAADEEWRRVAPVIEGLRGRVARADLHRHLQGRRRRARASTSAPTIVNDISALDVRPGARRRRRARRRGRRPDAQPRAVARHVRAARRTATWLARSRPSSPARDAAARAAGIAAERIILDPGLGFAKRAEHSLRGARRAAARSPRSAVPSSSGPSRKSFLKAALGDVPPDDRVWGTAAAVTASVLFGAHIVRVHDVSEMVQVVRVVDGSAMQNDARAYAEPRLCLQRPARCRFDTLSAAHAAALRALRSAPR